MNDIDYKRISQEEIEELIKDIITDEENLKCFTWYERLFIKSIRGVDKVIFFLFDFLGLYILGGFVIAVVLINFLMGVVYVINVVFKLIGI